MNPTGRAPLHQVPELAVARIASRQYGVFSRAQAVKAGFSTSVIGRRTRSGLWETAHPAVYRLPSVAPTWRQRLMAACLWAGEGAVASHLAAAVLWNFDEARTKEVSITIGRGRGLRTRGVVVHRTTVLTPQDRTRRSGIPLTSVPRTLIDCAALVDLETLEDFLDSAIRMELLDLGWLQRRLGKISRGRSGTEVLERLVGERLDTKSRSRSWLERRVKRLLARNGLFPEGINASIGEGSQHIGFVDLAFPEEKLVVEVQSYRYHHGKRVFLDDLRRQAQLAQIGWRVLPVTYDEYRKDPAGLVDGVRRALAPPSTPGRDQLWRGPA